MRLLRSAIAGCLALVLAGVTAASADTPVNVVYSFDNGMGDGPFGPPTIVGSTLYGTTQGLASTSPTVFSYPLGGSSINTLYTFAKTAGEPYTGVTAVGSTLYGMTTPGLNELAFSLGTDGSNFTSTSPPGAGPQFPSPLTLVGSTLYGMTTSGSINASGTVFSVGTSPLSVSTVAAIPGGDNGSGGNNPGPLVAVGNTLYGSTGGGGGEGTVFSVNTDGTGFTTLYDFGADTKVQALTLAGSTLYGIASGGPLLPVYGEIFSMNLNGGNLTDVYTFSQTDGPGSTLATMLLVGSTLYGTSNDGGVDSDGTLFSLNTTNGAYSLLHTFTGATDDGANPKGLALSGSTLYGTASHGGANNAGVIFTIPTPEPASIGLLLAGLPVLWFGRRTIARRTRRCRS